MSDLSDEAFWQWDEQNERQHWDKSFSEHALDGWQEARRRAGARERKAFEEGYLMRKQMPPLTPEEAWQAYKKT